MGKKKHFGGQNYRKLKLNCIQRKNLFVDVLFPPTNHSLFIDENSNTHIDIVWKRPAEIANNPKLFVEGATSNDVRQGILGNCWFVSACSALTHNQELFNKVIPKSDEQEWSTKNKYCGIFRFCFWRYGRWIEVVIDDLLPTRDGKLIFACSKSPNEFWSALLEKAFAKFYGCYENLVGGQLADALQDVSGGVTETISINKYLNNDPNDSLDKLFDKIQRTFNQKSLIIAAIAAKNKDEIEESLDCGLVKGHAYAVTAVCFIELNSKVPSFLFFATNKRQRMIRLQNPWGEKEWNGAWSDSSKEWEQVSESHKKELGITADEDGEFWMPWDEFIRYFTDLSLCKLFNTSLFSSGQKFHEWIFFDEWKSCGSRSGTPNDRAGGCLNFVASFCSNPQYRIDIDNDNSDVIFALTQQMNDNVERKRQEPLITIGMHLIKVEANRIYRVHQAINPIATSDYSNSRSVSLQVRELKRGRYILLPTTFAPREESKFLLRIYSPVNCSPLPLNKHSPGCSILNSCKKAASVSRLSITDMTIDIEEVLQLYCLVTCGKEKVRSDFIKEDNKWFCDPLIFYRSDLKYQYTIDVLEIRIIKDRIIGSVFIDEIVQNESSSAVHDLLAINSSKIGTVSVTIQSYDDPLYL